MEDVWRSGTQPTFNSSIQAPGGPPAPVTPPALRSTIQEGQKPPPIRPPPPSWASGRQPDRTG
eukprot:520451-Pyramimonas_sp.AAC.1